MYKFVKLTTKNRAKLSNQIKKMEADIYYPLGDDFFKIDHGDDYFAFFDRLGELHYWAVFDQHLLVGVAAGILRTINGKKSWYLCDLKVVGSHRGKGIPKLIFKNAFLYNFTKKFIFRAYAVSMNSKDKKLPFHKIKKATFGLLKENSLLNIYSFNLSQYKKVKHLFPDYTIVNTNGKKELILKSNGKKLSLNHLNKNYLDSNPTNEKLNDNSVIMISLNDGSKLDLKLKEINLKPSSDATILSFGIKGELEIFTDEI